MKFPSSMSLDETDSSDDSTYSSQYQSDANSTPRTGTSHTLPRNLPRPPPSVVKVKSLVDYESEILQLRTDMEQLQFKLSEAERQLQYKNHNNQREKEAKDVVANLLMEEDKLRREHLVLQSAAAASAPEAAGTDPIADKEKMILMQQKKISALDAANRRLLDELNRMTGTSPAASTKVVVTTNPSSVGLNVTSINTSSNSVSPVQVPDRRVSSSSTSSNKSITVITNGEATTTAASASAAHAKSNSLTQETPKTVDELLDSLHSTSI